MIQIIEVINVVIVQNTPDSIDKIRVTTTLPTEDGQLFRFKIEVSAGQGFAYVQENFPNIIPEIVNYNE